jgi:hypothetical protein
VLQDISVDKNLSTRAKKNGAKRTAQTGRIGTGIPRIQIPFRLPGTADHRSETGAFPTTNQLPDTSVNIYPFACHQVLDTLIDYTNMDVAGHNYLIHSSRFIHHLEHEDMSFTGKKKFNTLKTKFLLLDHCVSPLFR